MYLKLTLEFYRRARPDSGAGEALRTAFSVGLRRDRMNLGRTCR